MSERKEKVEKLIKELTAEFLSRENNRSSLITVTRCSVSNDLKRGTVFFTVMPENKEKDALSFAKRKRSDLREFFKKKLKMKNIPFLEIEIDNGEKNRQKIDRLLLQGK